MWCKVCDDGGIWEIQAGASLPARRPLTHNEHSSEPRHGPTMGGYNLNTVKPSHNGQRLTKKFNYKRILS